MKYDLYATVSLDGYVDDSGRNDELFDGTWDEAMKVINEYGNAVLGRNTYEMFLRWADNGSPQYLNDYDGVTVFVLTSRLDTKYNRPNVVVCHNIEELNQEVSERGFERGLLDGGSELYTSFIERDLVDKMILHYHPVLAGANGVPLFAKDIIKKNYKFETAKMLDDKIVKVIAMKKEAK